MEMIYNNYMISQLINILAVKKDVIGERRLSSLSVNGRNGEIFQGAHIGTRSIEVTFYMKYEHMPNGVDNSSTYEKVVKSLAYYLTSNDAPAKLMFSDDPNNYYLAMVESFDIERTLEIGEGTIVFKCFSPYIYSVNDFQFSDTNGLITIENDATASTYPVIETKLSTDTTYLMLIGKNGVVQVGNPNGTIEGDTAINPLAYSDDCSSAKNWYTGSSSLLWQDRIIDTNVGITSTGYVLKLNRQPEGEEGDKVYTGGFFMTNLPSTYKYWQAKLYFNMQSRSAVGTSADPTQMGMFEAFLFDTNNIPLTNFSMRDYHNNYQHNVPMWFSGNKKLLWKDDSGLGSVTTKTYVETFESLDDVPTGAVIIADVVVPKYRATVKFNGTTIYKYPDMNAQIYTKAGAGNQYPVKETNASWTSVYMNSAKTTIGYIRTSGLTVEQDGTTISVTYKMPTEASSGSGWNNFAGCVIIERLPHENGTGSIWNMGLYNKEGTNSWGGKISHRATHTIYDPDNTYTTGGNLAKIGFFLGSYNGAVMPQLLSFDDLVVTELKTDGDIEEEGGTGGFNYIGHVNDVIKVDMGEQMVYKNNEPFMNMVDVGSQFFGIDAFSSSDVRVITDDTNAETTATITKRYL